MVLHEYRCTTSRTPLFNGLHTLILYLWCNININIFFILFHFFVLHLINKFKTLTARALATKIKKQSQARQKLYASRNILRNDAERQQKTQRTIRFTIIRNRYASMKRAYKILKENYGKTWAILCFHLTYVEETKAPSTTNTHTHSHIQRKRRHISLGLLWCLRLR